MTHPALPFANAASETYQIGVLPTWQDDLKLVHVFLSQVGGRAMIAWEGTTDWQEWVFSDFMAGQIILPGYPELGAVHAGLGADVMRVIDKIDAYLASIGYDYDATGHSKGAGETILFHAMMKKRGHPPKANWAFEPPRVGGASLKNYLAGESIGWTRTHNAAGDDIVTDVPFGPTWFHQTGKLTLAVPDALDLRDKHLMPAVTTALEQLP